jgi:cytochrome d ubiquinol oxidase subunit II
MFEYETLKMIWWVLIGVLLIGFMITDGFDMGVGALLPIIGKTDTERRVMINSIAPHWDGNQVWLITAGGALFAAWPMVYATVFSSLYIAMYMVLIGLWLRPLALEYRAKVESQQWKDVCDYAIAFAGVYPPLLFGIAFGNLLQGIPFSLNSLLMVTYHGSFLDLLNPFSLLSGIVAVTMSLLQGSTWLLLKTKHDIYGKARAVGQMSAWAVFVLMVIGGLIIGDLMGYQVVSVLNQNGESNPLNKVVIAGTGMWLSNFETYTWMWFAPIGSVVFPVVTFFCIRLSKDLMAFISSSLTSASIILTAGFTMFPFIVPSSFNTNHSLTLWDATSSELTLNIMTGVAFVMVPIILGYTAFSYRTMRGRLDNKYVERNSHSLY